MLLEVGVLLLYCTVQTGAHSTQSSLCPDEYAFPSGGSLISTDGTSSCSRQIYESCNVYCPSSGETRPVYCNFDYTWNTTDPCTATQSSLCPDAVDFPSGGSLISTDGISSCTRQIYESCNVNCPSGETRSVYCDYTNTWNIPDPCAATQSSLCPDAVDFPSGGSLISTDGISSCTRQIYESCNVNCPSGETRSVYCDYTYTWNIPDPCAATQSTQCPDESAFPAGGSLISTDGFSSCSRQIYQSCNVYCPSGDAWSVYCDYNGLWNSTDPCAATQSSQCPDESAFPSGGSLISTDGISSCTRQIYESCNVNCPSGETRSVYCDYTNTWNIADPCAATQSSLCPDAVDFPSGGSLISTDGISSCTRQIYESCNVNCPSGETRSVYCDYTYTWNTTDPCAATQSSLCPDAVDFPSGGSLISTDGFSSCSRQIYEACNVNCPSGDIRPVYCDNTYTWDTTDPCAGSTGIPSTTPTTATPFRLYVTDEYGSVFILDDTGFATQEPGIYGAAGIAIDPLMSKTGLPNLVYGNDTLYSRSLLGGADENVLNARDYGGNARRLALDPTSGNLFYISASDASPYCNISVVSPTHDHVTLISGYQNVRDIVIHPQYGLLFFIATDVTTESPTTFIGVAFMDGSSVNGEDHIFWAMKEPSSSPKGLAIDYIYNRLYWTDSTRMVIESCEYTTGQCGESFTTFMNASHLNYMSPYESLIDDEFMYYSNMVNNDITKVRLSDPNEQTTFYIPGAGRLNAMTVYSVHFLQLLDSPYDGCSARNGLGDCSNLCLPSGMGPACRCREGVSMQPNGVTCNDATLCPDNILDVSLSTACYRHIHEECDYDCTTSGTFMEASGSSKIRCEEGGIWNNSMPCAGYRCPQEFPSGGFLTSTTEISCNGQPGETCMVYCTADVGFTVTCYQNGTWDNTDPCSGSSYQCPSIFPSGGVLMSYSEASCSRQANEACFVTCDNGNSRDVYCTEAGVWDNQDPCSKFLLYVTSTADQSVYVLDEMGAHIDTINIDTPIRGIAVDYFTHESTSTNHSFVYSVDSAPKGAWSYVFRKYVGDPPYSGVGDQIFAVIDPRATIERIAVDPTSGDIYYTGLVADATDTQASFIGVYRLDGSQSELINELMQPRDIVLNTDLGIMFWSDIGRSVISSAAMDGTSRTDIVTDVSAYGLAIDFQESLLYWAHRSLTEIMKCDFYGSNVDYFAAFPSGVTVINDITIHGRILYYTAETSSTINALSLDQNQFLDARKKRQTQMMSFIVPSTNSLDAIAIYNSSSSQGQTTTCPSGYITDATHASGCSPCPIGTYHDVTFSASCQSCPSGYTTHNIGSTSLAECIEDSASLCPQTFPSGGFLNTTTCNREPYTFCDVYCPSGNTQPMVCYPNGTWDKTDPCSAYVCPQTFVSGGFLNSTNCNGQPYETCNVYCPSGVTQPVMCYPNGTWDKTDPCSGSAYLCPQTFASGGFLNSSTGATCNGQAYDTCEVHCPSGVTYPVMCYPNGTWDKTDPCSGSAYLCPQTFASGGFLNSTTGATCNGQPYETCDVHCPSGVTHPVMCYPNGTWDNSDPCSGPAYLCNQTFASGGLLTSNTNAACNGQPGDMCNVQCPSGVTHPVMCYQNGTWNMTDPCGVSDKNPTFRILATNSAGNEIYSFSEDGQLVDTFNSAYNFPVHGIAVDNFMPMSTPTYNPSFVYSVESGSQAGFFRQFFNGTGPTFITMVFNVRVERIAIDSGSGNIYYTGINSGTSHGFIGVVSPSGDQMTLIEDLIQPIDIVLHGENGRMYWSDIGSFAIFSAYMDGTGMEIVATDVLAYGLALDHLERMLYWAEDASVEGGSESSVMSYDINEGAAIELQKSYHDRVLKDILIDGQYWYYTREDMPDIGKVEKTVIENEVPFGYVPGVPHLEAIAVYSMDSIATPSSDACRRNRDGLGDCSTICLPTSFNTHSCHCPDDDMLKEDGKTCKNATLCPDTITGGTFQNFESCSRFKLDVCGVICDASPVTTWSIQCNEDGSWDNPCSAECQIGYFANATAASGCSPCPLGQYQDVASSTSCKICPIGYSTPGIGTTSAAECYVECAPGTFWDDGECLTCPPGEVQPVPATTKCNPCPHGQEPNSITAPTECYAVCPQTFPSGGDLTSPMGDACYREPYEYCNVQCPSGDGSPIIVYCNPNSTWDQEDPCLVSNPDLRILATGYSTVYSFGESGDLIDMFNSNDYLRIRGIAIDHFMPMSISGPYNPSLVYSVEHDGDADFYRHFLNLTGPFFITTVSHVRVERIAIDSGSGNIYYTGINSGRFDVENPGFIGVVTPSGEHMTVKDDLIQPMDIVLHGSEGRMYWSDIGNMTIASSYMNGTGQEIIATNVEVYGLAFDHLDNKLYWIEVAFQEGEPMSSVKSYLLPYGPAIEEKPYQGHFLTDILIDGQYWYYTSNYTSDIGKVGKSVKDEVLFVNGEELPYFGVIAVYSGDSSSVPRNFVCENRDGLGDCSSICLPSSSYSHSCHCPDGDLLLDERTCKNATLCPETIRGGRFQNKESCSFFKLAVCGVICDDAPLTTFSIECTEEGYWDNPCSDPTSSVLTTSFTETASPTPSLSTQSEPYSSGQTPSGINGTSQPTEPAGPTPSESTGPTPSGPTGPTPSEPTGPTSSEPTGPTPSEPTGPTPSEPTGPTPAEPTEPTPSEPTGPTPSEPTGPTPSEPTGPTPSEPTGQPPSDPTGPTHSEPTGPTPSELTGPTPSEPTGPTSSEPTGPTPSEPTGPTPSESTGPTPSEPTGPTPSEPTGPTPSEPTGPTPSEPTGPTPSEPTGPTPSEQTEQPHSEQTGPTPSEQTGPTLQETTGPTPSSPSGPTYSESTGPTPTEPAGPTPSEPTGPTPSEQTEQPHSEQTGPTPSEQTGPTLQETTGPTPSSPSGPTYSESTGPTPTEPAGPTPSESTGPTGSTGDQGTGSTGSQLSGSTGGQVTGSTGSQVSGGTGGLVSGSTGSQVSGGTGGQVTGSTGSQVSGGTGGQVTGSTGSQVSGGTGGQVTGSTGSQVSGGTGGQVTGSTGNQGTGSTAAQTTTTTAQTTTAGSATMWTKSQIILNALFVLLIISIIDISF